uniref:Uncharacterized protein n=1 Tax=Arundo donax TaxID=35708 RepID=A0A0A9BM77_ARUDO
MHFIYTLHNPVQCRMHGSIQCGFQDPRNSWPSGSELHINGPDSRRSRDTSDPSTLHYTKNHTANHTSDSRIFFCLDTSESTPRRTIIIYYSNPTTISCTVLLCFY